MFYETHGAPEQYAACRFTKRIYRDSKQTSLYCVAFQRPGYNSTSIEFAAFSMCLLWSWLCMIRHKIPAAWLQRMQSGKAVIGQGATECC
jgi:hypothetical protein